MMMRTARRVFMLLGLLLCVLACIGQSQRLRRFSDYPAGKPYRGPNAPLVGEWRHAVPKTGILDAAKRRPDFAGHFVIAVGSCGGSCRSIYAVDIRSGRVVDLRHALISSHDRDRVTDGNRVQYRLSSRLIILRGELDEKDGTFGAHYFVLRRDGFHLVASTARMPLVRLRLSRPGGPTEWAPNHAASHP